MRSDIDVRLTVPEAMAIENALTIRLLALTHERPLDDFGEAARIDALRETRRAMTKVDEALYPPSEVAQENRYEAEHTFR